MNNMSDQNNDWAEKAASRVINNLCNRKGIKQAFIDMEDDVYQEIITSLAEIIREGRTEDEIGGPRMTLDDILIDQLGAEDAKLFLS